MPIISIENLYMGYSDRDILLDVNVKIEEGQRVGLIGVNGSGKTTLLRLITGELTPDRGALIRSRARIGYLEQSGLEGAVGTVYDTARSCFSELNDMLARLNEIESELSHIEHHGKHYDKLSAEYSQLSSHFESLEGYSMDYKLNRVLGGMGFSEDEYRREVNTLSGGEKTRLMLAMLLLREPELLILDEPTNHLDFKTLLWLEEYLTTYKQALLIVSHDRAFLDRLVTTIWDMEQGTVIAYKGNYTKYKTLYAERVERMRVEYERQQQEIAEMEDFVRRNIARASTTAAAKSRIAALERMERLPPPPSPPKTGHFFFTTTKTPHKEVVRTEKLTITLGTRRLFAPIDITILRGERIALIGPNGVGKSSLLKAVMGQLPHAGYIDISPNTDIGYFEQESAGLDGSLTVMDCYWDLNRTMTQHEVRSALGFVLLTGENVFKQVGQLSGGERARLKFAMLMYRRPNLLILDEPTNHLDIGTRENLEQALLKFDGTLIMVSHDRYFLDRIPTRIIELTENGIVEHAVGEGIIESVMSGQPSSAASKDAPITSAPYSDSIDEADKGGTYRSRQQRAEDAKRRQRIRELEQLVERTERELAELTAALHDPEVYSDYEKTAQYSERIETLKSELDAFTDELLLYMME